MSIIFKELRIKNFVNNNSNDKKNFYQIPYIRERKK